MKNSSIAPAYNVSQKMRNRSNPRKFYILPILLMFFISLQTGYSQIISDANLQTEGNNSIFTVELSDTLNITEIELSLGNRDGLSDLFSHNFEYDQTSSLPQGLSYSRQEHIISLGLGVINASHTIFSRIRVKHSGSWSDWYSFIAN